MPRSMFFATLAFLACSASTGGEDPPASVGVPDGIACGARRCDPGAVCVATENESRCVAPGAEENAPVGALVMKCDGREDCTSGDRCMSVRGELDVFQCMDDCDGLHAESVCSTDADCRRCDKLADQFEVRCRPHPIARDLSVCGWK